MDLYRGQWRALLLLLCAPDCRCDSPGKLPHRKGWQREALKRLDWTEREVRTYVEGLRTKVVTTGCNLGLALPPYVAALDVDTDLEGGTDSSKGLARDAILALCDEHPVQETGKAIDGRRIGVHVFGRSCDTRPQGTHYGNVPVTIRGVGNQVVVAPSRHANGNEYRWINELPQTPALLPEFDALLFRHVTPRREVVRERHEGEDEFRKRIAREWQLEIEDPAVTFDAGRRHEALLWAAWGQVRRGRSDGDALEAVRYLARTRCAQDGRFGAEEGSREWKVLEDEMRRMVRTSRRRLQSYRG